VIAFSIYVCNYQLRMSRMIYKPHNYFLLTALFFGLIYIFIVPPFQSPDEGHHLYRAYHLAEGHWFGEQTLDQRFGGELPTNLISLENSFRYLRYNYEARIDKETWWAGAMVALDSEQKAFVDFPNVAYYLPLPYLVQSISLRIGIALDLPPLFLLYLSRISGFLFWLTVVFLAVRLIPIYKNTYAAVALLPSSLFINSGMTADSFTYGLCYLLFAYIMKLAYGKNTRPNGTDKISVKAWLLLLIISLSITLSKVIYFPLLLLLFLISPIKFSPPWHKLTFIGSLFFANILVLVVMFSTMKNTFISYENYNPTYRENVQLNKGVNPTQQLDFIISNPLQFAKIALRSHLAYAPAAVVHCVGKFGWEKNYLPFWIVGLLILMLLAGGFMESSEFYSPTKNYRLVFLFAIVAIVGLFTIVIYMQWSPVRNSTIFALGGRYYLPLLPLFFLMLRFSSIKIDQRFLFIGLKIITWLGLSVGVYNVSMRYWI